MKTQAICRWGILGTAAIARKNWKAIRVSGNGTVVAVASRNRQRAEEFIQSCDAEIPMHEKVAAIEGYDAILTREDIDAVYLPLPTGIRKEWVLKAARAGKHVLCEKPIANNLDDAREMIEACAKARVQFMDGVMFEHNARMDSLREAISDCDGFGRLRRIQTHFSFPGDDTFKQSNIRAQSDLEPHGCLGDLGWYCIRFTLAMTGGDLPTHVSARTLRRFGSSLAAGEKEPLCDEVTGPPAEFSGELFFANGVTAGFYCSFFSSNQQTAVLSGDRGYVCVDDFVLPFRGGQSMWSSHHHDLQIDNCRWNYLSRSRSHAVDQYDSGESNAQEVNMVRELGSIAIRGALQPPLAAVSLATQVVLDACRHSDACDGERIQL